MSNLRNDKKKQAKYLTIAVSISIVTALILLQPAQVHTAPPPTRNPDVNSDTDHWGMSSADDTLQSNLVQMNSVTNCVLDPELQAPEPIDMNTVNVKGIAKTIHVEKEVFSCLIGAKQVVVDVTIYTELIENIRSHEATNMKFEVVTCVKYDKGVLGCKTETPSRSAEVSEMTCELIPATLPLAMNTVVDGRIVKTIEAEKEVFECDFNNDVPTTILDVTIFSEIFEEVKNRSQEVIAKKFEAAFCLKEVNTAKVLACKQQTVT